MTNDLFKELVDADRKDSAATIEETAREALDLQHDIRGAEEHLANLKKRQRAILDGQLPSLLAAAGLSKITLDSGDTFEIVDYVSGGLPKEPLARDKAIDILTKTGHADLIKTEVKLQFGRSQHNEAQAVIADLRDDGHAVHVNENIHPMTLKAFVRQAKEAGEELPWDDLGIHIGITTKMKEQKK